MRGATPIATGSRAAGIVALGVSIGVGMTSNVLWAWLRRRNPLVADLATLAALGYALAGGAGAAVLAMVGPVLMSDYAAATDAAAQAAIATQFTVLFEVVWRSIWQLLDGILVAGWWLGIGILVRTTHPGLSRLSVALSAAAATGVVLNVLGLDLARDLSLGIVFSLWTAWWIWLLVLFLRPEDPLAGASIG